MIETDAASLPCRDRGTPDPAPLREDVWRALMAVAGPQDAPWLIRQIHADLIRMRSEIVESAARGDAVALRAGSHSLAGLAGTIGAVHLQSLAALLNQAVHDGHSSAQQQRIDEVLRAIPPLLKMVEERLATPQVTP